MVTSKTCLANLSWEILGICPNQRSWDFSNRSSPVATRGLGVLAIPSKAPTPLKWNYKALYVCEVFIKFQNVKPPEQTSSPPFENFLATVLIRRSGLTFRDLRISNLCTSSLSVIPWTLRKNAIFTACSWESVISVVTQGSQPQMRIETKTDLKTDSFAIFQRSCFTTEQQSSRRNTFAFGIRVSISVPTSELVNTATRYWGT